MQDTLVELRRMQNMPWFNVFSLRYMRIRALFAFYICLYIFATIFLLMQLLLLVISRKIFSCWWVYSFSLFDLIF